MNFPIMGRLSSQIKTMEMETRWYLKKQSGNYTDKSKSLDKWINSTQNAVDTLQEVNSHGDDKLRAIHAKLFAGGTLTAKEREYLKIKDPKAYNDLVKEEAEQKAYEEKLRKCRTKEEVDRLKTNSINKSLSTVKSVENNPYISNSTKLEIAMHAKRSLDRINKSTMNFIQSGKYGRLPSENEETDNEKTENENNEVEKQYTADITLENEYVLSQNSDNKHTEINQKETQNSLFEHFEYFEHKTSNSTETKVSFEYSTKTSFKEYYYTTDVQNNNSEIYKNLINRKA